MWHLTLTAKLLDYSDLDLVWHFLPFTSLRSLVFAYGWAQTVDLRHCFYQFPMCPEVATYFCFRPRQGGYYAFGRMAMGWSWAPSISQRTALAYLDPILPHAAAIYDDYLILGRSVQETASRAATVDGRIARCHGTKHPTKSMLIPSVVFVYMGIQWDLQVKAHRLSPEFVEKWSPWMRAMCMGLPMAAKAYWSATAVALYAHRILCLPPFQLFHLQRWAASIARSINGGSMSWRTAVRPTPQALAVLRSLTLALTKNEWVTFCPPPLAAPWLLYTDASSSGWAWTLCRDNKQLVGQFGPISEDTHINVSELHAILTALEVVCTWLPRFTWTICCDNATVVFQLKRFRSASFPANSLMARIHRILQRSGSQLTIRWVDTKSQLADPFTRLDGRSGLILDGCPLFS